ncbi:ferredoxin-type protein NapF [Halomonas daqingensis]|uniref:ferredoxin-type protein NapF n=1 Tax=Billgrantia desiderata TaxID=52021 RepID=UPI001F2D42E1|nr:ferredoxin-type protein NapF [Halomonas desiderata]MCE8013681.1 ferredoxin-type protein NapF [Halomonas desiderata]MCE8031152.1 ferredoxin-type protein NapF [Halomonas desiderata]
MHKANNHNTRRQFFRSLGGHGPLQRPPWTDHDFTERCVRCAACIETCPEGVLFHGGGGYPEIRFDQAGCSLCRACVEVCDAGVFDTQRPAFPWRARIESHCLALADIHCQSCQDACEWQAIVFSPQLGRPPKPRLNGEACTGCGACQALCPNHAITMTSEEMAHAE